MCWPVPQRLRRTGMLQRIIRGAWSSQRKPRQAPEVTHILSGTSMPRRSRTPVKTASTRAQSPRRDGPQARVRFGQDVMLAIEAAEILRQRRRHIRTACWARACPPPPAITSASDRSCRISVRSSGEWMAGAPTRKPSLSRLAQDRLDAHRRILQIGPGLALELREALQVEDVVGGAVVGEIGELDGGDADLARDLGPLLGANSPRRCPARPAAFRLPPSPWRSGRNSFITPPARVLNGLPSAPFMVPIADMLQLGLAGEAGLLARRGTPARNGRCWR